MPEWRRFVKEHLKLPEFEQHGEERIYEELVDHLEQVYREAIARGESAAEAEAQAIEQLGDCAVAVEELVSTGS